MFDADRCKKKILRAFMNYSLEQKNSKVASLFYSQRSPASIVEFVNAQKAARGAKRHPAAADVKRDDVAFGLSKADRLLQCALERSNGERAAFERKNEAADDRRRADVRRGERAD